MQTQQVIEGRTVPTLAIIAYLSVIYAWLMEGVVLLIELFGTKKFDPFGHAALVAVAVSLSLFAAIRGKRDFARLRHTRGRIPLTLPQIWIIGAGLVGFSFVLGMIAMRMTIDWN